MRIAVVVGVVVLVLVDSVGALVVIERVVAPAVVAARPVSTVVVPDADVLSIA